jgi:hypothetical protein
MPFVLTRNEDINELDPALEVVAVDLLKAVPPEYA